MKPSRQIITVGLLLIGAMFVIRLFAAETKSGSAYEYATIRWDGKDNTHVVRPGGQVEFIGPELRKMPKPARTDDRAFYMNLAMNGLTKEGYEFAGISSDEIVMKRSVAR
jgi:hypothetical protein